MSQLYRRQVKVQVGDGAEAVTIPNAFKIRFELKKLVSSTSSEGSIGIYNLADTTKEIVRDRGKRVRLFAGYGDTIPLLHDGDVLRVSQDDQVVDRITNIFFGGRIFNVSQAVFSRSYQGDVSLRTIVGDALPSFGLQFDEQIINIIPADATIPNFSFNGKTATLLNQLLRPLDLQWFERNSEVLITQSGEVPENQAGDVFVLNSTTGLIKTAVQSDKGVNVVCLLNPRIVVGSIVKIESDVLRNASFPGFQVKKPSLNTVGFYKVIQITYQGDNWDGKFQSLLQCVPFGDSKQ